MTTDRILTTADAFAIAKIVGLLGGTKRVVWVPNGDESYTGTNYCSGTVRQFTDEHGNFIGGQIYDVRDAYLWISGTFEYFILVSDIIDWIKKDLFMEEPAR